MPHIEGPALAEWLLKCGRRLEVASPFIMPAPQSGYGSGRGTADRIHNAVAGGLIFIPSPVPVSAGDVARAFADGMNRSANGFGARLFARFMHGMANGFGHLMTVHAVRAAFNDGITYLHRSPIVPVRGGVVDVLGRVHEAINNAEGDDVCDLVTPMRVAAQRCAIDMPMHDGFRPDPGGLALAAFLGCDPPDVGIVAGMKYASPGSGPMPPSEYSIISHSAGRFGGVVSMTGPQSVYQWSFRCSDPSALVTLDVAPTTQSVRFSIEFPDGGGSDDLRLEVIPTVDGRRVARPAQFFWQR